MKVELVSSPTVGPMVDPFGRQVTYLRVSVTDRCDFRCVYCMSEHMTFLPKKDLLTLEELDRLCSVFIARGVPHHRRRAARPQEHHLALPRPLPAP
jgi:GTP 3',8-cyclase